MVAFNAVLGLLFLYSWCSISLAMEALQFNPVRARIASECGSYSNLALPQHFNENQTS